VKLSLHQAPLSPKLNIRRILSGIDDGGRNAFMIARYLAMRGDARVPDMAAYAAQSKWRDETRAVGAQNFAAANQQDTRATGGLDRVKMHTLFRYAVLKVMRENHIDVFVHPNITVPPGKIGGAHDALAGPSNLRAETMYGPNAGLTEILIPAGYVTTAYDPVFTLSEDRKRYVPAPSDTPVTIPPPGLPFSLVFRAEPGREDVALKIASAYEGASKRRVPPPAFGPLG
jgi:Asp-tRNA(Asn)/Glu-tRNA(Gln) amidotransferase A subunit family amidase